MKINNRKVLLHKINVTIGKNLCRQILVTPAQLAKLNRISGGEEVFLSNYYCYSGGGFYIIRNDAELQYMPHPHRGDFKR